MDADPALARPPGSRRQYLTLLFADLSDSTWLGDMMEGEDYASLLGELRALCRSVVARHGGEIARIQGDGMLAFFGWPNVAEDDGRRAAMAALDLHAGIARLSPGIRMPGDRPLRMHSGIHAGLVLVSEGDVERGRFELVGNVPNIAAHLSSLAGQDDILISKETLGPHHRHFLTGERQTIRVGKLESPLVVYRVLGRAASREHNASQARADLSPFVGRDAELRVLHTTLREAIAGANACCVVSAPAGMGKSRLIEELARQAANEGTCALRGTSEDHLGAAPLQPFLQALQGYCQGGDAAGPCRDLSLAARAKGFLSATPELQGEQALRELVGLFADLAAIRPTLVVLDDWQWADEASQKVLEGLRALDRPMMLLLGTRTAANELLLARPAQAVVLEPLDARATSRMMETLLPGADPFVVSDIHRHAGGNPLYLEELCHAAQVPGWTARTGLRLAGPAWLSGLIESRVGRLPAEQAEVVRCAAVLGNAFPAWLLEQITGHRADGAVIRGLATSDLLFAGEQSGMLRFKHGITRDVIYGTVGLQFRQRTHLRVVEALTASDGGGAEQHIEALAYHCAAGGRFEAAAHYAELAGDKAMAASALDRARTQYTAALKAMDEQAPFSAAVEVRWCEVAQKLGVACVFDPLSLANGLALFERALLLARHSGRLDLVARAEYWLGYVRYARGQAAAAGAHCEVALELARQLADERLTAQVRAVYGQVLLSACRYDEALPLLEAGLEQRRRGPGSSKSIATGAAYTLACKGYLLGDRGLFAQAEECFGESLRLIGDARHQVASSVRHWRCVVFQWQGRWEDALRMADDSADIAEYTRSRQQLLMGRAMAGYVRWVLSRRAEDLQALRDATSWIEACDGGLGMSLNHSWMVESALANNLEEEARRHAARLFMRNRKSDRLGEALGCRALALNAARLNQFARADRYLARAKASALRRGSAHEAASNQLCEAQVLLDRGAGTQARVQLDRAMAEFESMAMHWHLERARRLAIQAAC